MSKPLIYVASPYTKGDPTINTHFQCRVFDRLLSDGLVIPFVPLWCHFQHCVLPRHYQDWIDHDLEFIRAANFDACLRLNVDVPQLEYFQAESTGADNEVELFHQLGKPVYYSIEALYRTLVDGPVDQTFLFWPE